MSKEKKPDTHVTIRVKNQDNASVYFRIKRDLPLRTLMEAFSVKVGNTNSIYRFFFDGVRVKPDHTPNELELEDEDEIDALVEQVGGHSFCHCD